MMLMFIIAGSMISPATWSPIFSSALSRASASLKGTARVSSVKAVGMPPPWGTLTGSPRAPSASSGG
jgi:hypothetical protein